MVHNGYGYKFKNVARSNRIRWICKYFNIQSEHSLCKAKMTTGGNEIIDDGTDDHIHGPIDDFDNINNCDVENVNIPTFLKNLK